MIFTEAFWYSFLKCCCCISFSIPIVVNVGKM
jgi:hypothetical protein